MGTDWVLRRALQDLEGWKPQMGALEGAHPRGGGGHTGVDKGGAGAHAEESELRQLRRENTELLEELAIMQQTPREEFQQNEQIEMLEEAALQLRVGYNNVRSEKLVAEKNLRQMSAKLYTMQLDCGETPLVLPSIEKRTMRTSKRRTGGLGASTKGREGVNTRRALIQRCEELEAHLWQLEGNTCLADHEEKCLNYAINRQLAAQASMEPTYNAMKAKVQALTKKYSRTELSIRQTQYRETQARQKTLDMQRHLEAIVEKRRRLKDDYKNKDNQNNQIEEYLASREKRRLEIIHKLKGDMDRQKDMQMKQKRKKMAVQNVAAAMGRNQLEKIEAAFRKIATKTGESNLENLLQKMQYMESNSHGVEHQKEEKEKKVAALQKEKALLTQQLQEIQINGMDFSRRRTEIEDMESQVSEVQEKATGLEEMTRKHELLLTYLSNGLETIMMKLDNVKVKHKEDVKDHKEKLPAAMGGGIRGDSEKPVEGEDLEEEKEKDPILLKLETVDLRMAAILDKLQEQVKDGDLQDPISPLGNESPRLQKPTLDLGDRQFNMRVTFGRPAEPRDSWDMDDDVSVGAAAKSYKKTLSRERATKKKGRTLLERGNRGKVGHR